MFPRLMLREVDNMRRVLKRVHQGVTSVWACGVIVRFIRLTPAHVTRRCSCLPLTDIPKIKTRHRRALNHVPRHSDEGLTRAKTGFVSKSALVRRPSSNRSI